MIENEWILKEQGPDDDVKHLSDVLSIDKSLANLLVQRGIKTFDEAKAFFRPCLEDLHDPFLMKDMDKAITRLDKAISNNEKILVYGDYDVDGTTSVALVYTFLHNIYPNIEYYVPDRYSEGYGISKIGIDWAAEVGVTLIIALDCGIKAIEKIAYAKTKDIDFIICDHHTADSIIPDAVAVLDPKRNDCTYPYKELSGCGVGFKLLQAYAFTKNLPMEQLTALIDLVCVSIASDIVPVNGENRILSFYGLNKLNEAPMCGLRSVLEVANMKDKEITISDIVFKVGPRINAAGRIHSARKAVDLLVSTDSSLAKEISALIDEYNSERKDLDQLITAQATEMLDTDPDYDKKNATVLYREDWHKGVIGIVASRLVESHYRPTVIMTKSNGKATGSARSVYGFNLYNAIESCADILTNFGGHMYAAGLTLEVDKIDEFIRRFDAYVSEHITKEQLIPKIEIDSKLNLSSITPKFYKVLRQFAPFGPENMSPVFMADNVYDTGFSKLVGKSHEHLKLELYHVNTMFSGIAFGQGRHLELVKSGKPFSICFTIVKNEFNGRENLQLVVKDIKPQEPYTG